MSAYQCSPEHIAFICAVYNAVQVERSAASILAARTPGYLFGLLTEANAKSVAERYREKKTDHGPRTVAIPSIPIALVDANVGAVLKSIACLEYQSCEAADWEHSEAHCALDSLRSALLERLPGADRSDAWGLPDLQPVAVAAPVACASVASECVPGFNGSILGARCAPEIVCNPDEPKRWQLPVWRVAKGREDCRLTGDHALTYALPAPAYC